MVLKAITIWRIPAIFVLIAFLLHACSTPQSRYQIQQDGAPQNYDAGHHTEPKPLLEPKSRYGNKSPYTVLGKTYRVLPSAKAYKKKGIASWYGKKFHGHLTSNREVYDMHAFTAAHKSLPLPSTVRVTNLENGRSVVVRVNDRGPFHDDRLIDLSYAAAKKLDIVRTGTARVKVVALSGSSRPSLESEAQFEGQFYLQVGAFGEKANAKKVKKQLAASRIGPVRIEAERPGRRAKVYRVQIGPLETIPEADRITAKLLDLGFDVPHIVRDTH